MVTILHGEDNITSREKLKGLLSKFSSVTKFDAKELNYDSFVLVSTSVEMFSEKKAIVIENIFKKKDFEANRILDLVKGFAKTSETSIFLWEHGKVDSRLLRKYEDATILFFEFPKYYFQFLDNLAPINSNSQKKIYDIILKSYTPEQIFYSLVKRVRLLMVIKNINSEETNSSFNLSSWQVNKLKSQARYWSNSQLKCIHSKIFDIELGLKSSNLVLPLSKYIDILLYCKLN